MTTGATASTDYTLPELLIVSNLGRHKYVPLFKYGPVAQLDRVLASEAKGRGFESRRDRQTFKRL